MRSCDSLRRSYKINLLNVMITERMTVASGLSVVGAEGKAGNYKLSATNLIAKASISIFLHHNLSSSINFTF